MTTRRSIRKKATEVVMVTNGMTGETLGRVGNLSIDGLMIIGQRQLGEDHIYQIQFALNDADHLSHPVEVGIQCLWSEATRSSGSFWSGCKIIDIAPEHLNLLAAWIERAPELA